MNLSCRMEEGFCYFYQKVGALKKGQNVGEGSQLRRRFEPQGDGLNAQLGRTFHKKKGKIVLQTHNIVFKPTETLAKNTKKIQKNVPARARYIIRILSAPRNNVGTIQRVSCHPGTPRMLEY